MGPDEMMSECERLIDLASAIPDSHYQVRDQIQAHIGLVDLGLDKDGSPSWFQQQTLEFFDEVIRTILEGGIVNEDE